MEINLIWLKIFFEWDPGSYNEHIINIESPSEAQD
jgi:hypothetical protein